MSRDLPESLETLMEGLAKRGFVVVYDESTEAAFGNRVIELRATVERDETAVRLVKDRGLWSTEIQLDGSWYGAYDVLLALNDQPYRSRAESHDERVRTTLAVVDGLASTGTPTALLTDRLGAYRREYWARFQAKPED